MMRKVLISYLYPRSGVLGPEEDEDGNPVGLVYFCCARSGAQPVVAKEEFGKQKPEQRAYDRARLRPYRRMRRRAPRFIVTAAARRTRHSSSVLDAFDRLHGRHAVTRLIRALEPP
jgi:nicotinamide mononucleotide (NMN) deamidase PncC